MNHLAFDAHIGRCNLSVRNARGIEVDNRPIPTNAKLLIEAVEAIPGKKQLVVEEGILAGWLKRTLESHVDRFVVCNPKQNAWILKDDEKDDPLDAEKLSFLLFAGRLKPVHHPEAHRQPFKNLVLHYHRISVELARIKIRIKSKFREHAIHHTGTTVFRPQQRADVLTALPDELTRLEMQELFSILDFHTQMKRSITARLAQEARKHIPIKRFRKVPGIGLVRAASYYAVIDTPYRFQKKTQLWVYCGIGLKRRRSGDDRPGRQRRNQNYNRLLKDVAMSAARTAVRTRQSNPFKERYERLLERGVHPKQAIVRVARSLMTTMWGMWKANQDYRLDSRRQ